MTSRRLATRRSTQLQDSNRAGPSDISTGQRAVTPPTVSNYPAPAESNAPLHDLVRGIGPHLSAAAELIRIEVSEEGLMGISLVR